MVLQQCEDRKWEWIFFKMFNSMQCKLNPKKLFLKILWPATKASYRSVMGTDCVYLKTVKVAQMCRLLTSPSAVPCGLSRALLLIPLAPSLNPLCTWAVGHVHSLYASFGPPRRRCQDRIRHERRLREKTAKNKRGENNLGGKDFQTEYKSED